MCTVHACVTLCIHKCGPYFMYMDMVLCGTHVCGVHVWGCVCVVCMCGCVCVCGMYAFVVIHMHFYNADMYVLVCASV